MATSDRPNSERHNDTSSGVAPLSIPPPSANELKADEAPEASETLRGVLSAARYSGPLPPPHMLAEYERVIPGLATQLVESFAAESQHRRRQEEREMSMHESELAAVQHDRKRGQQFAFALSILFLSGSVYLIANNHDWAGTIIGGTTLGSLVTAFIFGRRNQPKE